MAGTGIKPWRIADLSTELGMNTNSIRQLCGRHGIQQITGTNSKGKSYTGIPLKDVVTAICKDYMKQNQKAPELSAKARSEIAKAEQMETRNRIEQGKYIPINEVVMQQAEYAQSVARFLDALPSRIHRAHPDAPPEFMSAVDKFIKKGRNDFVDTITRDGVLNELPPPKVVEESPAPAADYESMFD